MRVVPSPGIGRLRFGYLWQGSGRKSISRARRIVESFQTRLRPNYHPCLILSWEWERFKIKKGWLNWSVVVPGGRADNCFLRQIATRKAGELRPPACSNKRFTYENSYQPFLLLPRSTFQETSIYFRGVSAGAITTYETYSFSMLLLRGREPGKSQSRQEEDGLITFFVGKSPV